MERISIEEAVSRLCGRVTSITDKVLVPLSAAPGRVLAADLIACTDVPPFHKSPLDGYALRSEDIAGAGPNCPVVLTVIDRVFAGGWSERAVERGQAVRIMTGAPIPDGADCVVGQEDTDEGETCVQVFTPIRHHQNFSFRGEDISAGTAMFSKGTRLDWTHIAALAGQGIPEVEVYRLPCVAVITTGDELSASGTPLAPGKIYDSNGPFLCARLTALHMEAFLCPIGADRPEELAELLRMQLQRCDAVITSGGVSVGQKDYMPQVAERLHAEILFHGVAARPGSPTMAMMVDGKPIVALSGNPFAAAAVFEVVARRMLEHLAGCQEEFPRRCVARLRSSFTKGSPMRRFVRARLVGEEVFVSEGGHASGMMVGMAGCNCLIDIPAGAPPLAEGAKVDVLLF